MISFLTGIYTGFIRSTHDERIKLPVNIEFYNLAFVIQTKHQSLNREKSSIS
jgi:hypothetical protein